jgi:hypothetical protein
MPAPGRQHRASPIGNEQSPSVCLSPEGTRRIALFERWDGSFETPSPRANEVAVPRSVTSGNPQRSDGVAGVCSDQE